AVISVRTMDNACFVWSVVATLYLTEKYGARVIITLHYTAVLNLANIEFPMILKDISKFLIKKTEITKKNDFSIYRCLHCFSSYEKLQSHEIDCQKINDCAIQLASEDDRLEFDNYNNRERMYVRCAYDDTLSLYYVCLRFTFLLISSYNSEFNFVASRIYFYFPNNFTFISQQWEAYRSATRCHICEKSFVPNDTRVRDHLTGRYRGSAHSNYNLNSFYIPIIFHNLSGYAHFIIKKIAVASAENFDLLTRKSVFPYLDYIEKLTSDLYFKTNVLLLADIFENFRNNSCVASYCLNLVHYTLSSFTWDAETYACKIRVAYRHSHIDIVMFIERDDIHDLSQCYGRHAQINNKYMHSFDPSLYLMYYDVNNLYGWAMCQPLPTPNFDGSKHIHCQSCIQSKLYTISEPKIVLSPYDNKRYVVPDLTETLPLGALADTFVIYVTIM
ncbi:hypothetical protein ALC53_05068, partial [Atta colombica]